MSVPFRVPAESLRKQERVSDPAVSAWVSANAGAGKTTVLVRRVIRLLLDGNPPARILCLTFTKAAAANMANKVLETLSEWVRLDDAALDDAIGKVSPLAPTPAFRTRARRLFAEALETPGGLKVQTIHAFCDRVLHQFPVEAGVQAGFAVLDEVQEQALLTRAREAVLIKAANEPDGALGRALAVAVAAASDDNFAQALDEAVRQRRKLRRLQELDGRTTLAKALGLSPRDSSEALTAEILNGPFLPREEWIKAAASLQPLGGNAKSSAERIISAANAHSSEIMLEEYLFVFFTTEGEPRPDSGFGSANAQASAPDIYARLFDERDRLVGLRDRLFATRALERTAALLVLAEATVGRYEHEKGARGAVDYGDLIEKTADMLGDTGSAWVLYKLDGGIDHVLIDEAQDTSPEQWNVIERLTEEFFAGRGAREDRVRTIFVVGDDKQSIFSFQGADPRLFGEMREAFRRRVSESGQTFHPDELVLSFRSARGVLAAVDAVFKRPQAFQGLSSSGEETTVHEAIRTKAPALVEIWETEKPVENGEEGVPWDAPLDARSETSPTVRLAQRIASAVEHWTDGGLAIEDRESGELRTPTAGDVIVLVRQRGPLFEAIIQALKKGGIAVAGADRLKLAEHIAVMDLMALGDALLLDADDLALACALKSPLFGLHEQELYLLAHGRQGTLAAVLHAQSQANPRFAEAAAALSRWREEAAALRPFDFYSRVLGRDGGRARMLARLGHEAADAIDEFLARALDYEQTETPSLAGFLHFLRHAGTEVKRDLEVESDAVRVMTVHGAKGLEAPIVVLADTTSIPDGRQERLIDLPGSEAFVWAGRKKLDSTPERAARAAADELRQAEYRRLLYVALTRAADALVVCGYESEQQIKDGCWYKLVRDALEGEPSELVATQVPYAGEGVWRWRPGPAHTTAVLPLRPIEATEREPWLAEPVQNPPPAPKLVRPSRLDPDGESSPVFKKLAGRTLDPRRRGDLIHRLLHRLPHASPAKRADSAALLLSAVAGDLSVPERQALAQEAIGVIEDPALAELFGAGSRGEVDIAGYLPAGEIAGRIDRIAVTAEAVLIADFKTGTPPSRPDDTPQHHLAQLRIYRDLLAKIYPGRAMRTLLVWTAGPAIQEIGPQQLDAVPAIQAFGPPVHD
jgi:ATP-dependent helicase/nuclease subunit A